MAGNHVDWEHGRITAAGLAAMRAQIGVERAGRPWNAVATADAIRHFAEGVGDDNPLWHDPAYAAATVWDGSIAPPTFAYTADSAPRRPDDAAGGGVDELLPGVLALWKQDRWRWTAPVREGDRVASRSALFAVEERPGAFSSRSVAQTMKTTYTVNDGRVVAELYRTVLRLERAGARERQRFAETPLARYSEADLAAIRAQYEREPEQRRGGTPRYWEDIVEGEPLITLVKGPLTVTNMIGWLLGWGSPMCMTNRLAYQFLRDHPGARLVNDTTGIEDTMESAHWEPYFAQRSGLPTGYDFGVQRISWTAHLLTDWCGDAGFLTDLDVSLRRPNLLGDVTWLTGSVTGKRRTEEDGRVDCAISGTNQRGETTMSATASVRLPSRG